MGFKKGQSGNPKGRPIGTLTSETMLMRAKLTEIVEKRMKRIEQRLDECEAKDELYILIKFIELCIPKPVEQAGADVKKVDFYSEMLVRLNKKDVSGIK